MREDELASVRRRAGRALGRAAARRLRCAGRASRWCAPPTSSSTRTNWSPGTATSPSPTTRGCSTPWTCGARTSSTGCRRPPCRRSPPRWSPYATWTWSTTTRWPQALALLSRPPLRDALTQPVRVLLPGRHHGVVRPYTAWWLRGHPVLDGRRPAGLRAGGRRSAAARAVRRRGRDRLRRRAGAAGAGRTHVRGRAARRAGRRGRTAGPARRPGPHGDRAQLHALYRALADLDPEQVTLPDELRAVVDGEVAGGGRGRRGGRRRARTCCRWPAGLPLLPVRPARAAELAELFQVRRLSESVTGEVRREGEEHEVPESVRVLLGPATPHDVRGARGARRRAAPNWTGAAPATASCTPRRWRASRRASPGRRASGRAASRWRRCWRTRPRTDELARDRWFD